MGIYLNGLDGYPAWVCRVGSEFRAQFVDIPGCLAYGASALEAERNAARALSAHVDFLEKHRRCLPCPSIMRGDHNGLDRYIAYIRSAGSA